MGFSGQADVDLSPSSAVSFRSYSKKVVRWYSVSHVLTILVYAANAIA